MTAIPLPGRRFGKAKSAERGDAMRTSSGHASIQNGCSRHTSDVAMPLSCCFRIAMICSSLNRDLFILSVSFVGTDSTSNWRRKSDHTDQSGDARYQKSHVASAVLFDWFLPTSVFRERPTYETRIDRLERDRIVLQEKIDNAVPEKGRLEDCMELALRFLSSPWNIYKNGDYALRQTVLRLAFAKPLRYNQNGVYGTPEFSFPFKYLEGISGSKSEMVLLERIELSTSPLPRECSTSELQQRRCALVAWRRL